VTYRDFLSACRKIAGEKLGREISKAEFARLCEKDEKYYTNMESGAKSPGRELLERAAKVAGFEFENCIVLPVDLPMSPPQQRALDPFIAALHDWRLLAALDASDYLQKMKKPKKPKLGGRTRKPQ